MTSSEIILIIGAIGVLVGGLTTAVTAVIKAFGEFRTIVNRVDAKADVIAATTAKIDGHVNSEKTAGEGRENTLRSENVILREMMAREKTAAMMLAQVAAGGSTTVVHATNGAPLKATPAADSTLEQIETNTKDTAANTARTEAKVEGLAK